jgi:hypothetical protein
MQGSVDQAIMMDKPPVIASEAQETPQLGNRFKLRPVGDCFHLGGSVATPCPLMIWPRYSTCGAAKTYFDFLAVREWFFCVCKTCLG